MQPYRSTELTTVYQGDCRDVLAQLPAGSVHTVVTSPPYWGLRDYGVDGQLGLEPTPDEYVQHMVEVFRAVRRVLRDDGTVWLNLGDSYVGANNTNSGGNANFGSQPGREGMGQTAKALWNGLPSKNLVGIPWRVAFALQADGWWLRSDIIWHKPNPMPESVTDRPTKAHEYIFLLSKAARYYYDQEAIREDGEGYGRGTGPGAFRSQKYQNNRSFDNDGESPASGAHGHSFEGGRNRRTVWTVATQPFSGAHFATFPEKLIEPCILAGCPEGGTVLDPFHGSGTTGRVAVKHRRHYIGIELKAEYIELDRADNTQMVMV